MIQSHGYCTQITCTNNVYNKHQIYDSKSRLLYTNYPLSIIHDYIGVLLIVLTVESLNPVQARCTQYNICDKFVSDLWQVSGFLWVLRFPPPIKLTITI